MNIRALILKTFLISVPISLLIAVVAGHRFSSPFIYAGETTKLTWDLMDNYGYSMQKAEVYVQKVYAYPTVLFFTLIIVAAIIFIKGAKPGSHPSDIKNDTDTPQKEIEHQGKNATLVGISGWLILPALGIVLGITLSFYYIVMLIQYYSVIEESGYGTLILLQLLAQGGLTIFLLFVAKRFFAKKSNAPMLMIKFLITGIVVTALLLSVEMIMGIHMLGAVGLVQSVIIATIWIPYFRVSKRVVATFINQ